MAPTASPKPVGVIASDSSSEEETSSSGDEQQVEQRPAKSPIRAPVRDDDESESSEGDDESESSEEDDDSDSGAPPPLPPHLQGAEDDESSDGSDSDSDEAVSEAQTLPKGNVPSPDLAKPSTLKRTAAIAELATPPSKKKKAPTPTAKPAKSPQPEKPAAAAAGEDGTKAPRMVTPAKVIPKLLEKTVSANKVAKSPALKTAAAAQAAGKEDAMEAAAAAASPNKVAKPPLLNKAAADVASPNEAVVYNAEKHLQEKSEAYWYLAQELKELETELNAPGRFNAAFLNIADGKATALDNKIKKHKLAGIKLLTKGHGIKNEVIRTISKLME